MSKSMHIALLCFFSTTTLTVLPLLFKPSLKEQGIRGGDYVGKREGGAVEAVEGGVDARNTGG